MPKICMNGIVREMTPEEAEFFSHPEMEAPAPTPDPSPDERIAALEEELKAAKILLGLEV